MKTQKMKVGIMALAVVALSVGTVSCNRKGCTDPDALNYSEKAKKDDGTCEYDDTPTGAEVVTVYGAITSNTTWTNDKIYKMVGKVVVEDGVTLTIEAGTIVQGAEGTGSLASALVVARGGKLIACGTAAQPIIFTSELDNIQPGELTGTNLTEADQGLWGGVIMCGRAPISAGDGDDVSQIEGIPAEETYGAYGGTDAADNSGTLCYVSIRHGGALIGAGNEINGLTLGGVGTGTSISNIEIVANVDDGVEFFGGTVNASNILVSFQGDDGIDIDQNYAGTVSNFTVLNGAGSDEALEIDGPEGTATNGLFTLENGSVSVYGGGDARGDFKSKAQGTVTNVLMGTAKIRASYQNNCADPKTDAFTNLTVDNKLVFSGAQFTGVSVYNGSLDDNNAACYGEGAAPGDQAAAEAAMTSTTATGNTTSSFTWTWSSVNGKL